MANENENLDSQNEETKLDDNIELSALKDKYQEIFEKNKQLFERAKKAEGEIKELKIKKEPEKSSVMIPEKKPDEFGLLQKTYLRAAGVVAEDEIELARDLQKKTGLDWDKLVDDDFFKAKLENLRTSKANADATSNIRGGQGSSAAKNTVEYWLGKGEAPPKTPENRKLRADLMRALMNKEKEGKKFYND